MQAEKVLIHPNIKKNHNLLALLQLSTPVWLSFYSTVQKCGVSKSFGVSFVKGNNTSATTVQQGCIKLFKSNSEDIYNVTKDFYFK